MNEERTRQIVLWLLIFMIGASAMAFGSVELWAREWLRFAGLVALTLAIWSVGPKEVFGGTPGRIALPFLLIAVWGVVQSVPVPEVVVRTVSPRAAALQRMTVPPEGAASMPTWLVSVAREQGIEVAPSDVVAPGPEVGVGSAGRSLSLYPYATRRATLSWLTAVVFFLVAAWVSRSAVARYRLLWGVSLWAGCLGLIGILQRINWNDKILWIRDRPRGTAPLGPFVNPTHYAGYVELGTLVALGLILALLSRSTGGLDLDGIRDAILDRDWALPRLLLLGGVAILGVSGLLLSGSEGGLVALGAGLVFLALAKRLRGGLVILGAAVIVIGVSVGLVSSLGPAIQDMDTIPLATREMSPSFLLRLDAWGNTLDMFRDFPVAGTGLGTFAWAYVSYQRSGEWQSWDDAHNDYLQLLAEAGMVGVILVAWGLWVFARRALRPAVKRSDGLTLWTSIATAAALFAMLVHSIVDFNLQTPSNAVLFAVLAGVLAGAARESGLEAETT